MDKFKENLTWMIQSLRDPTSEYYAPWTRVILITPPPISVSIRARELAHRNPPQEIDRSHDNTSAYVNATKEIAAALKVPLVSAWDAIWAVAKEEAMLAQFLSDGLHLTKAGYEVWSSFQ
jgi:lysophospholipase L1-like esterase